VHPVAFDLPLAPRYPYETMHITTLFCVVGLRWHLSNVSSRGFIMVLDCRVLTAMLEFYVIVVDLLGRVSFRKKISSCGTWH
jgi:hypothetical protein